MAKKPSRWSNPTIHTLKTWPELFTDVFTRRKTFEVRPADRDFQEGDILHLVEWDPATGLATGRRTARRVTYILGPEDQFGIPERVVMGIREDWHRETKLAFKKAGLAPPR